MLIETPSLLITDDDPGFRETLRVVFEPRGFRTLLAGDGEEALQIVHQEQVHVVLLDVHMPKLTGLETLRADEGVPGDAAVHPLVGPVGRPDRRAGPAGPRLLRPLQDGHDPTDHRRRVPGVAAELRLARLTTIPDAMAKVLVTGGSGFIGTHLVAALAARGDEVTCLVRNTSRVDSLRQAGARLVYGDVTDRESLAAAVAGQGVVYHLAGRTQSLLPRQFYAVNGRGVANVARACAGQTTPPVLVSVSSLAAAGPAANGQPKTESDRSAPVSHYGHSKRAGERAAEAFAHRVPITIVRPPIVLGEGDRLGLPLFRSIARFGVHMVPGFRRRRFSLIHAADLVQLLILAARCARSEPAHMCTACTSSARPPGPRVHCEQAVPARRAIYFAACEEDPTYADLGRMVARPWGGGWCWWFPRPRRWCGWWPGRARPSPGSAATRSL